MKKRLFGAFVAALVLFPVITAQAAPPPNFTSVEMTDEQVVNLGLSCGTSECEDDLSTDQVTVTMAGESNVFQVDTEVFWKINDMPAKKGSTKIILREAKTAFLKTGLKNYAIESGCRLTWKIKSKNKQEIVAQIEITDGVETIEVVQKTTAKKGGYRTKYFIDGQKVSTKKIRTTLSNL